MLKPISKDGEELIFYNYKEPLKEVEKGYGYYGVLLSTKEGDAVQCHICGNTYDRLDAHIISGHKMKVRDYKEKFKLAYKTALVSEKTRVALKIRTIKWLENMSPAEKASFKRKARERYLSWKKNRKLKQPNLTLETKNKRGTCPDQLLEKIRKVAEVIGRSPSKTEFIDHYKSQKYIHIIYKTFGSWENAKKMAGLKTLPKGGPFGKSKPRYSNEELLEYLQIFYKENGKIPTETDCRRGLIPESSIYRKRFGSFPEARLAAGITGEVGRWKDRTTLEGR